MKAAEWMDEETWEEHIDIERSKQLLRDHLDNEVCGKAFRAWLCFAAVTHLREAKAKANCHLTQRQVTRHKQAVLAWTACCMSNRVSSDMENERG